MNPRIQQLIEPKKSSWPCQVLESHSTRAAKLQFFRRGSFSTGKRDEESSNLVCHRFSPHLIHLHFQTSKARSQNDKALRRLSYASRSLVQPCSMFVFFSLVGCCPLAADWHPCRVDLRRPAARVVEVCIAWSLDPKSSMFVVLAKRCQVPPNFIYFSLKWFKVRVVAAAAAWADRLSNGQIGSCDSPVPFVMWWHDVTWAKNMQMCLQAREADSRISKWPQLWVDSKA